MQAIDPRVESLTELERTPNKIFRARIFGHEVDINIGDPRKIPAGFAEFFDRQLQRRVSDIADALADPEARRQFFAHNEEGAAAMADVAQAVDRYNATH